MTSDAPRDIRSGRPFEQTALEYLRMGWYPVPLPEKDKFPPVTGFTGRGSTPITKKQVQAWLANNPKGDKANIGLSMGSVVPPAWYQKHRPLDWFNEDGEPNYIVIGIDVDDYVKGQDVKHGGEQLRALEKELGPLPDTWISSARGDGVSGIRYFLAPAALEYRGKAASDIDIVSHTYRFAVVGPSHHPEGGLYGWFAPGCTPAGQPSVPTAQVGHVVTTSTGRRKSEGALHITEVESVAPQTWTLPELPKEWLRFLSREFTPYSDRPIDMDIEVDDLWAWCKENFGQEGGAWGQGTPQDRLDELAELGCGLMKRKVEFWADEIVNDTTSHDKILYGHWNLLHMGIEGHRGWHVAARVVEDVWMEHVFSRGKRSLEEGVGEMFRSRTNALRKIKAEADAFNEALPGDKVVDWSARECGCYAGDEGLLDGEGGDEFVEALNESPDDPDAFERNDDGNAEHLLDLIGENLRWVQGHESWIYWNPTLRCWQPDDLGLTRRAWRLVKKRQLRYAQQRVRAAQVAVAAQEPGAKEKLNAALGWLKFAEQSGNNSRALAALEAARSYPDVSIPFDKVNSNRRLLGVANGVLELQNNGAILRPGERDDMITKNTGVPYYSLQDQRNAGGALSEGVALWEDYLETFLPDVELRRWVQQLMGYCLLGMNPKRKIIFLYGPSSTGKSTMLTAVMGALGLGQYSSSETMEIFSTDIKNPQLVAAIDNRVITLSEVEGTARDGKVSTAMLKRMSGMDVVKARNLNSNELIQKIPAFTPVIATNHAPPIDKADSALDRRVVVVPFNHSVSEDDPNKTVDIEEKCAAAVLAWMVEGWALYCEHGLGNEPRVREVAAASESFKNEMSPVGEFLNEWVARTGNPNDYILFDDLYAAYLQYCKEINMSDSQVWNKNKFGRELTQAQVEPMQKNVRIDGKQHKARHSIKLKKTITRGTIHILKDKKK